LLQESAMSLNYVLQQIADERRRQIDKEYTPEHDDQHVNGELASAAAFVALERGCKIIPDPGWDWGKRIVSNHCGDRRRQLIIAAALLVAEIERLGRAAARKAKAEPVEERDTFNGDAGLVSESPLDNRI